jgi:two-component system KDP operon response regulator KdpE
MNAEKPWVLIVDDEPQIRRLLTVTLEANQYRVIAAASGQEGLILAAQHRPALVILDLGLPDFSGQEVLRRLREWSHAPVIILSVQDDEKGKVAALDAGADDYVTKPFNTDELLARVRAALRRSIKTEEAAVVHAKNLVVDLATRRVTVGGKEVKLSKIEYDLLRLLARHAGKVLTHRQILQEVWGAGHENDTHYLRVYIAHLREKLESNPEAPELILTELGVGYRFLAMDN